VIAPCGNAPPLLAFVTSSSLTMLFRTSFTISLSRVLQITLYFARGLVHLRFVKVLSTGRKIRKYENMVFCDCLQSISGCIPVYVDRTKSLNFYGANYRACFNWDGAHNRALIIIHLKKSVKRSYINLEYKTLTNIVYEDKMSAQPAQRRSNSIVFQCASLNIFVVVYLTNLNTTLIG